MIFEGKREQEISINVNTYLKDLDLQSSKELLENIFKFLADEIESEYANRHAKIIASLFCRSLAKVKEDIAEELKTKIIRAFDNIKTIANDGEFDGELECINFLNKIYSKSQYAQQEMPDNKFLDLLDNLDNIKVIFRFKSSNENRYFPIGSLLSNLINKENFYDDINKPSSIQALMLALQVFDKDEYNTKSDFIQKKAKDQNLKFVDYLLKGCDKIGNDCWKGNYEKNGLLILRDSTRKTILIRSTSRLYFEDASSKDKYNLTKINEEKNMAGDTIAYWVEYPLQCDEFINIKEELRKDNNCDTISQLLNLIYLEKNYNVAYEDAFFRNGNMILLTNPYTKNDSYYISTDTVNSQPKETITKFLSEYSIMRIAGKGLNYINFGLILKLEELFAIPYKDFGLNENSDREYTVEKWLDKCEDKKKLFNLFLEAYSKEIDYLSEDSNKLLEKQYITEANNYFLPFSISTRIMDKVGFSNIFQNIKPVKCDVKSNLLQGDFQIYDPNGKNITEYESECMDEESDFNYCECIYAAIDNENNKYYYGNEAKKYYDFFKQIKQICKFSEISQITDEITEDEIRGLRDKMECFKDALKSIHPGINMMSITRYRLLHHILYLRLHNSDLSNSDIKEWIKLINRHDTLKYDIIKKSDLFKNTDNVLYIPKDNPRSQATLRFINNIYIYTR